MSVLSSGLDDLLRALNSALRVAQLYPRGHQSITSGLAHAENELRLLFRKQSQVDLGVLDEEIVFHEEGGYRASSAAGHLLRVLQGHGVDRITFKPGCTAGDLSELIDVLQQSPETNMESGGVHRVLQTRGVHTIILQRLTPTALQSKDASRLSESPAESDPAISGLLVRARSGLDGVVESIESHHPIAVDPARVYVHELAKTLSDGRSPLLALTLMERHEDEWLTHLVRVTTLAVGYGRRLGLSSRQMESLGTASFLYDVGLMALGASRESVREDDTLFQMHPVEGARLLLAGKQVDRLSVVVAFEHHMLHDLSGFPRVPGKHAIHPMAELVGLADDFVNLVTPHGGHEALRSDEAIMQLARLAGTHYDGRVFSSFVSMVGVFAPGTFVLLSDGRLAMVVKANPARVLRPLLRIIADESGRRVDRPLHIDLAESDCPAIIVRSIDPRDRGIDPSPFTRSLIGGV